MMRALRAENSADETKTLRMPTPRVLGASRLRARPLPNRAPSRAQGGGHRTLHAILTALLVVAVPTAVVRADAPAPSASSFAAPPPSGGCIESIPPGANRPTLDEHVPAHVKAGELIEVQVAVTHGAGESATLPGDLAAQFSKGEVKLAEEWGHGAIPITRTDANDPSKATTVLTIPLVVLSTSIPRQRFTLPAMRVVVLRQGGGDLAVCTKPHDVDVDQPIANTPHAEPRPNPPTLPQITRNEQLQRIVAWSLVALLVGALLAAAYFWWKSRPKPPVPAPPPPAPWTVALADLAILRGDYAAKKLETKAYYDRLSDIVRRYLGDMYSFDALDMTTDETMARLRRLLVPIPLDEIAAFFGECDLVKFADQSRDDLEAEKAADVATRIVRTTSGRASMRTSGRADDPPRPRGIT